MSDNLDKERYAEWYQYPFESGYWWRKSGQNVYMCLVEIRPDEDSKRYHLEGTPLLYAHYWRIGDMGKIAIFETEERGVSWQKVPEPNNLVQVRKDECS